jgi:hypothetical protein
MGNSTARLRPFVRDILVCAGLTVLGLAVTSGERAVAQSGMYSVPFGNGTYSATFGAGPTWTNYSATYGSTGTQLPNRTGSNATGAALCGGFTAYYPIAGGLDYGGGFNACADTTGTTTLFNMIRHPLGGAVIMTVDPGARLEPFAGVHYQVKSTVPLHLIMRVGPVFASNSIAMTSNQTGAGGNLESASKSLWTTGIGTTLGLSWQACSNCALGRPLNAGVLWKTEWFRGSESINLPSMKFGFVETGSIERTSNQSLLANFSVPF